MAFCQQPVGKGDGMKKHSSSTNGGTSLDCPAGSVMKRAFRKSLTTLSALSLLTLGLAVGGCGGGGSGAISSQVVSGTAAVGAPLSGQVSLKDSSTPSQLKTTVIGSDGSFAIDVTSLKAPFVLQAKGSADGVDYKLHSFADDSGIANVNPLSDAIVASAAGVDDPSEAFEKADSEHNHKIRNNMANAVTTILTKLQPLLVHYNAQHDNPITSRYITNHLGLDDMFDNVRIKVTNGTLTIINTKTKAVIFTGLLSDIANGVFNGGAIPPTASLPAAPAALSAAGGTGQVTLSWSAVSAATSYNLYYATAPGLTTTSGTKISTVTSPYVQTGLPAGTTYYYLVTAVNSAGESAASAQASAATAAGVPTPSVPAAPTGQIATGGTNQVTLSWGTVSGATSYTVYYATTSGVTKANGTKISNAVSPAVQTGLAAGTTYYYIVTASNAAGEGAASAQVAATTLAAVPSPTAPAAPAGVTAVGGANQATISWPAVTGAASYNVYWSTATGVTKTNGTKVAGVTSPYVKSGLAAGTSYYFIVTAVNSVGESAASAQASASTSPAPIALPAAPTGVSATGGTNQVTLNWAATSGATSYNVYYATSTGVTKTSGAKIVNATSPYVQTSLAAGTTYYYIVTAVNSAGEGTASAQASATTAAAPVLDGLALYNTNCVSCHGTSKMGKSAAAIQGAISGNIGGMNYLSTLSAAQIAAIATTTAPAPVLDGAALYASYCAGCHGTSKRGKSASATQSAINSNRGGMGSLSTLTPAQITAISLY
jgi:fibronectin type 3 domain-containing protein